MIIKICEELQTFTNGTAEVSVDRPLLGDALEEVFNQYPQLLAYLSHKNCDEAARTSIKFNDEYIWEERELYRPVSEQDTLELLRDIPEGAGTAGKIIAGVAIMGLAIALSGGAGAMLAGNFAAGWGAMGTFGQMAFMMGASLVIGGVADMIIGQPKLPTNDAGGSSNTYNFSGIKNSTAPGTPVGVVYGRHRVGGHVLNVYDRKEGDKTFLYMQVGMCEGPISRIDANTLEINKRNIHDYPAQFVETFYRLGTENQETPATPLINVVHPDDVTHPYEPPIIINTTQNDYTNATVITIPNAARRAILYLDSEKYYNYEMVDIPENTNVGGG